MAARCRCRRGGDIIEVDEVGEALLRYVALRAKAERSRIVRHEYNMRHQRYKDIN